MTDEKKIHRSYRICPCNAYDVEGIQTWLEDLARDGLLLENDGYFWGFFTFVRTSPRNVTYRLEPVQTETGVFDNDKPAEELVDTSAQMGWEYLTRYGMFHIYRTADPYPRELHTDPAVQAMALDAVRKRLRNGIIHGVVWIIIWFVLRSSPFGYLARNAATVGLLFVVCCTATLLRAILLPFYAALRLRRYRKRLIAGDSLTARKEWKRTAPFSVCGKLLEFILPILCVVCAAVTLSSAAEQPIEPAMDTPFVSIADLIPAGEYDQSDGVFDDYNVYRSWSTALSPVNIEWNEWAEVTGENGIVYGGILRIDYHETSSEWLAEALADDYYHYDRRRYSKFSDLDAPETDADSIRIYSNHLTYVLIQHDNVVIHATMTLRDQNDVSIQALWIAETVRQLTQLG